MPETPSPSHPHGAPSFTVEEEAGKQFQSLLHTHMEEAFIRQGDSAFEMTKPAACLQEAGHCIVYAAMGFSVSSVRVWRDPASGNWRGETASDAVWAVSPETPPEDDLRQVKCLMAGALSGNLFSPNTYRAGTALDKLTAAQLIVSGIAAKQSRTPKEVWESTADSVKAILRANSEVVRKLFIVLERERRVKGQRLAALLAGLQSPPDGEAPETESASIPTEPE